MLPFIARFTARPWGWFLLAFLLFAIHLLTSRFQEQVYDANGYWKLAGTLYNGGEFSLLNFDSGLRGYLLPLLYVPVYWLTDLSLLFSAPVLIKLLGAALAALLTGVLLPQFWHQTTGRPAPATGRVLLILLSFLLWRDYFNYTLSDFPALTALLGALLLLLPRLQPSRVLLAGLLVAAATNIRPIYLAAVPLVAILVGWLAVRTGPTRSRTLAGSLGMYTIGFALLTLPQWLINRENFGSEWPLVIGIDFNDPGMVENGDLYLQQLNMGLTTQKYETSIARDFPVPQVSYHDPIGELILRANYNHKLDSYAEYLAVVREQPFDMVALNLRHLFNGLDVLYSTPYLFRVYASTAGLALLNYTGLFAGLVVLLRHISRLRLRQWLCMLPLLTPAVLMIPLPMECRYLMPLHLGILAAACFGWPADWSWQGLRGRRLPLLLAYLLFVGGCFVMSANTQALLKVSPKLLS